MSRMISAYSEDPYHCVLDSVFRSRLCTCCKQAIVYHFGVCDDCAKDLDDKRAEASKQKRFQSIPVHLRWASLDNQNLLKERIHNSDVVATIANCVGVLITRNVSTVLIVGPAGTGKSSLSCAIMREVGDLPRWRSAIWQCAVKLGRARMDSALGAVPPAIEDACNASLLVLDDLGSEHQAGIDSLREVIHHRHHAELPTIYTSWMRPEDLADRYGEGTARRITERATIVRMGSSK